MDNRLAIFVFFLFCSVSFSAVCLYQVCKLYAHALSLLVLSLCFGGEFQAPPVVLEYELQLFSRFQWICLEANILDTMPRRWGKRRSFGTCGHGQVSS